LNENETRDLGTLLQITGRLVEHFLGENFLKFRPEAEQVLYLLLKLSNHHADQLISGSIDETCFELLTQAISSLRPFQHWLSQYYSHCQTESHSQQDIVLLSNQTVTMAFNILIMPQHEKLAPIKKVSAQLIHCWASIVRPAFTDKIDKIGDLVQISLSDQSKIFYEEDTLKIILLTSASLFLLPYPNTPISEQNWQKRKEHFKILCEKHHENLEFLTGCCELVYRLVLTLSLINYES